LEEAARTPQLDAQAVADRVTAAIAKGSANVKHQFKGQFAALSFTALFLTGLATVAHAATSAATTPPSVVAFNQKIEDGSVSVEYAYLPEKGYAVIYGADKDGNPIRESLGQIELTAGDHRSFKIKLDKAPLAGSKLWVSLYTDKDGKAGFDRKADTAIWQDRLPATNQIVVQ
jgi:hypothetical protein